MHGTCLGCSTEESASRARGGHRQPYDLGQEGQLLGQRAGSTSLSRECSRYWTQDGATTKSRTDRNLVISCVDTQFTSWSRDFGATVQPKAPTQSLFSQDPHLQSGCDLSPR